MPDDSTLTGDLILGIDLGTTNSLVAIADDHGPRCLSEPGEDEPIMPSVVRFGETGDAEAVGREARARAVEFPERTIYSVKRLMGRSVDDAAPDLDVLAYAVARGEHDTARVRVGDRLVSPQEVSAIILRALRERAERALGRECSKAVVTVPAYFDDAQRQATRDAGRLAGLEVVRIVNEPTAAALAYGVGLHAKKAQTIAVFDLGGGTFDVSVLRVEPREEGAASDLFEVLSTAGDTRLGGDDVDRMIVELAMEGVREEFGEKLEFPPAARQALRSFAEAVKIRLSTDEIATLRVDLGGGRVFERSLTRDDLEGMIDPWVERAIGRCAQALRDARLTKDDIDEVVMVGGSTRIPLVRRRVGEFFGVEPYTALDPDRVVALGAAVQAAVLAGTNRSALLFAVIPLSLGVETMGGGVAKLIVRNSTVPARAVERFSTSVDGQTSVKLNIVQGEREMVEDCRSLGEFHLSGLPPMPAGVPQLEVEFLVDANGVLSVHAQEKRSGKRIAAQIVPNHGLSRDEVDRVEAESFTHAREDMTRRRIADLVTHSKLDLKWIDEQMSRHGGAMETNARQRLAALIAELRGFVERAEADWKSVDADAFHEAKQSLDEASVPLHEIAITASLKEAETGGRGNAGA